MEEIEGFFRDGIPARQWKRQPKLGLRESGSLEDVVEKGNVSDMERKEAQ
jgi:hypothetical protein